MVSTLTFMLVITLIKIVLKLKTTKKSYRSAKNNIGHMTHVTVIEISL